MDDDLNQTGQQILDSFGSWPKMSRLMLGKCATMQARCPALIQPNVLFDTTMKVIGMR